MVPAGKLENMSAVIGQKSLKLGEIIDNGIQFIKEKIGIGPLLVPVGIKQAGIVALITRVDIRREKVERPRPVVL